MVRIGVLKPTSSLIRSCRRARKSELRLHNHSTVNHNKELTDDEINNVKFSSLSSWVPHPRNGIYYPKGKEWVMDDVPEGAASFSHTYWLRSVEGVEEPFALDFHEPVVHNHE
ncbi:hypothetical protein Scep_001104 [Stephania cephalantha]|uniref:Uncharacterized protein n=1 Tax=Stephania cephalantha TaxID=152367 RepID=A0AAP0L7D3_9MAGN